MANELTCSLCELPCGRHPVTRTYEGSDKPFCCMGCANVYAILLESGTLAAGQNIRETDVFRRSLELGLISNPATSEDNAPTVALDPRTPTKEILLQVNGMWCSACAWLIERGLRGLPGVVSADVFFASDLAKITYRPQALPPDRIADRIRKLGYESAEYSGDNTSARTETHDLLLRLGVSIFLWANIMGLSTVLYVGYFEQIAASASRFVPFVLWFLCTPLVLYCAWPILRTAALGIRNLQVRMESLLALGILAAYVLSAVLTLRGQTHLYFDTAAAIVTLVLAGKLIERVAKDRASRSIALLYRLLPKKVRVLTAAGERFVSIDALVPGQIFLVKAGERLPADGVIVEGETHVDESLLSGESAPVRKRVNDTVVSGSLNADGVIQVRATRIGDESALAQIIQLVERALSTRAPIERIVDRVSRIFVPAVVLLAAVEFSILSANHYGAVPAMLRATTLLVIACPCALGLATPLAITAAVGRAARQGLLISDSRVLETMGKIDVVVLDKTGTVTRGDFRLTDFALYEIRAEAFAFAVHGSDPASFPPKHHDASQFLEDVLPILAGLESYSEHLLGRAVAQYASDHGVVPLDAQEVEIHKGEGISGTIAGRRVLIGNRQLMTRGGCTLNADTELRMRDFQEVGRTVALFAWNGAVRGILAFGDEIKDGAVEMIERLRARGIAVKLVTGDAWPTASVVARKINVDDFIAEATPAGKERIVEELQQSGKRVAMIGDGVNDAPALARADLGIALGTGADIAMGAAPVVLVSGSLAKVEELFRLSSKATRVVRQNLFWAFCYNVVGIGLALSGIVTPIFAAAAMLFSSSSVVINSMRLTRQGGR